MQKTLKKLAYLFIIVENSKKMIKFIVKKKVFTLKLNFILKKIESIILKLIPFWTTKKMLS